MIADISIETVIMLVAIAVIAALIGFVVGKFFGSSRKEMVALRREVDQRHQELRQYRKKVKAHLNRTAGLFVTMAGSYKELYDHLSQTYEQLAQDDAKNLFKAHLAQLMLSGSDNKPKPQEQDDVRDAADAVQAGLQSGQPVSGVAHILPDGKGELSAAGTDASVMQSGQTEKAEDMSVRDEKQLTESSAAAVDSTVSAMAVPVTAEETDVAAEETAVSSPELSDTAETAEKSPASGKV